MSTGHIGNIFSVKVREREGKRGEGGERGEGEGGRGEGERGDKKY